MAETADAPAQMFDAGRDRCYQANQRLLQTTSAPWPAWKRAVALVQPIA